MFPFDLFISYSTRDYLVDALYVTCLFENRGLSVWFDLEQCPERLSEPLAIAELLSQAVQKCNYLLFFDLRGWLAAVAITVFGASSSEGELASLATFWQWFERQFADRIIDIVPQEHTIEFGCPKDNKLVGERPYKVTYTTYEDAVAKIEKVIRL